MGKNEQQEILKLAASLTKEEILIMLKEAVKRHDAAYSEESKEDAENLLEFTAILLMTKRIVPNNKRLNEVTKDLETMENMMKLTRLNDNQKN